MVTIISPESANKTISEKKITFRWIYIILPVAILLLSIILTGYFYRLLPPEVAYQLKASEPDRWASRSAIVVWTLTPQFIFVLLAAAIVLVNTKLNMWLRQAESTVARKVLSLMGNMVALPQIILGFAMLDIFLYNAYQIDIMPLWIFALIVLVLGGIILGVFFIILVIRQFREVPG